MKFFLLGSFQKAHDPQQSPRPIRPMFALATLAKESRGPLLGRDPRFENLDLNVNYQHSVLVYIYCYLVYSFNNVLISLSPVYLTKNTEGQGNQSSESV